MSSRYLYIEKLSPTEKEKVKSKNIKTRTIGMKIRKDENSNDMKIKLGTLRGERLS